MRDVQVARDHGGAHAEGEAVSMSTMVVGFKPPNETWLRMKAVWDACAQAHVEPPREVQLFFDYQEPQPHGVRITAQQLTEHGALREWRDDCSEGYEIDVLKLPKDVTVVRFYNSW